MPDSTTVQGVTVQSDPLFQSGTFYLIFWGSTKSFKRSVERGKGKKRKGGEGVKKERKGKKWNKRERKTNEKETRHPRLTFLATPL